MAQQATPFLPTINVVPNGFKWSLEAANRARQKGSFIRVGGQGTTRRFLSGAKRSWASTDPAENRTVFHTGYRITGTPENINIALTYAGVAADQINQVLASVITSENWNTTMADEVAKELALRDGLKEAKPATDGGYSWEQIMWFAQNLKTAIIATKTGEQKGGVTSPGRAGAGESFAEKVRKLPQGKVIDVSGMDINTGKGIRTVNAPRSWKSGKYGSIDAVTRLYRIPIISNDLNKYIRAVELAYGVEAAATTHAADIEVVRQGLANTAAPPVPGFMPGAVPTAPAPGGVPIAPLRAATPPRVPGATIAPAPVFTAAVPRVASPQGLQRVGTVGGDNFPGIPALNGLLQNQ
jgi:hypothetical protein